MTTFTKEEKAPSPSNFDSFLTWACNKMQADFEVAITRSKEEDGYSGYFDSQSQRGRKVAKIKEDSKEHDGLLDNPQDTYYHETGKIINIEAIYDNAQQLAQLKFLRNHSVSCSLFKLLSIIIPYHPRLTRLTIDSGLDKNGLSKLSEVVNLSHITELILDGTVIKEANYYLLLENPCQLKYLSLARCMLNDVVIEMILSRLETSNISVLNFTSNRITDEGAFFLAKELRSNRKIAYLNLSGNMITDVGADSIFNSLTEFSLTAEEVRAQKIKHMAYIKKINQLAIKLAKEARLLDMDKKVVKKKPVKSATPTSDKGTSNDIKPSQPSLLHIDATALENGHAAAEAVLGPFQSPFKAEDTVVRDGKLYCLGNNALTYLSLAYNNLSYISVKKLYDVLLSQNNMERSRKGLVRICIDGNNVPSTCEELREINDIMDCRLNANRRGTVTKKKISKTASK